MPHILDICYNNNLTANLYSGHVIIYNGCTCNCTLVYTTLKIATVYTFLKIANVYTFLKIATVYTSLKISTVYTSLNRVT